MEKPVISNYEAPRDFPDKLPTIPPNTDEIYQLLEVWTNIDRINSLRVEQWDSDKRSEYMLWTTVRGQQFRVIWDDDNGKFWTERRTKPM